ncbi:hypothetical protein PACTADRAFT_47699 [Pachysolen tannophilus NRRL Y-2460]|uniref:Secondary thiamine-phosphate synthase enzyme n=1 Tax=Pachysolen tannophilus NRRL Y-2460 TaxID=669874 RepID=A0A1E4U1H1_PACTA|nr:hypothetical protein PACTADRAFT_47699 [Pachysolen tannophilus NRRL Y-2460]
MTSSWEQKTFKLKTRTKGCYLVTDEIVANLPELKHYKVGTLNLFMQHTSAALSLNENWDSDVRLDMNDSLDRIVVEHEDYRHSAEGPDDMTGHIKSSLVGASLTIPITNGRLNTGTWQGIWYMEFRRFNHNRSIVATINGLKE